MSIVKFGSIITSGSGSLGGSTIQPFRSTHVLRKKPLPPKSRTPAQLLIRSFNKTMQAGWRSLTDRDRSLWNNYAKEKPVFNRSGEKYPLSGHSLWMKYQYTYLSNYLPFLSNPADYLSEPLGPEIITNGGFDSPADWVLASLSSIHDGALYAVGDPVGYSFNHQANRYTYAGESYLCISNVLSKNGLFNMYTGAPPYIILPIGFNVQTFNQIGNRNYISIFNKNGSTGTIDYISLRKIL